MRRTLVPALVAGVVTALLAALPAYAEGEPVLSISNPVAVEPQYPETATSAALEYVLTIDQPASTDVVVTWARECWMQVYCEEPGTVTIPAGATTASVVIDVPRTRSWTDVTQRVAIYDPIGAVLAAPVAEDVYVRNDDQTGFTPVTRTHALGAGFVRNTDKAGFFECHARTATVHGEAWVVLNGGGKYPVYVGHQDTKDFGRQDDRCYDQGGDSTPITVRLPAALADWVVQVEAATSTTSGQGTDPGFSASYGDTRPHAGDFGRADVGMDVHVTGPGTDVWIRGLRSSAMARCEAVGPAPTRSASGAVGSVAVNGTTLPVVPEELDLAPGVSVSFGETTATMHSGMKLTVAAHGGSGWTDSWVELGRTWTSLINNPCTV